MARSLTDSREKLRCLNCFQRFSVSPGDKFYECPECKVKYVIVWAQGQAKIAGEAKT
jgi:hypothetical protein